MVCSGEDRYAVCCANKMVVGQVRVCGTEGRNQEVGVTETETPWLSCGSLEDGYNQERVWTVKLVEGRNHQAGDIKEDLRLDTKS